MNRAREEKRIREWETMQSTGHLRYLLRNTLMWIGSYTVVNGAFLLLPEIGWAHGSGMTIRDILICGGFTGAVLSELHWSDMKRKFRIPPPQEDWMAR